MNTEEFSAQIKAAVIDENTEIYRDLFENTETATDPYWIRALALYKGLNENQRAVFLEVVRQIAIDAVSNVFAVIDGVAQLHGQTGAISFRLGNEELSGELQDRFLEQFE
jgi:hypothetical protein